MILHSGSGGVMGHHINKKGEFQSDKYPDLPADKIVIDITDERAWPGLLCISLGYYKLDPDFSEDLESRVIKLMQRRGK